MNNHPENKEQAIRPPIVVVMGHVDHGKTSLLDYIRKSRVAEKEAGGITQSVGAYEIEKNGQKITFIDTPGHQAFTKMRERGAKVADLAILVVAADDGVQPQTKEAISILQESKTPFVVAINKIDKNNSDPEKTKTDLLSNGVYLEKYGGNTSWVAISAKTGEGVDELLDLIILMWQMELPKYDSSKNGKGIIIESKIDSGRGVVASVIIKDGSINVGDSITTDSANGKIKLLENFLGKRIESASPSSPVIVLGFSTLPAVGEEFECGKFEIQELEENLPKIKDPASLANTNQDEEKNILKFIVKADVSGSLEALSQILSSIKLANDFKVKIMSQGVGDVTDGDMKLADTLQAQIICFNCKISKSAENLSRTQNTKIISSDIIYRIIEEVERQSKDVEAKEEFNILEVLAVFSQKGKKQVIGGKIIEGFLTLNQRFEIERGGQVVGAGRITNMQKNKSDCKKIEDGECGLMVESESSILVGDKIVTRKVL